MQIDTVNISLLCEIVSPLSSYYKSCCFRHCLLLHWIRFIFFCFCIYLVYALRTKRNHPLFYSMYICVWRLLQPLALYWWCCWNCAVVIPNEWIPALEMSRKKQVGKGKEHERIELTNNSISNDSGKTANQYINCIELTERLIIIKNK